MATLSTVMAELKKHGSAATRKTLARHGAPEQMDGVKVADLKKIAKTIKGDQQIACQLYDTGHADAQYLAGIVADGAQMTQAQLDSWAKNASWHMVSEYSVPGVACEHPQARGLALKWIKSKQERVASSGWCTYAGILATQPDEALDLDEIKDLLAQVLAKVDSVPDRVRYTMNGFVISVGSYVKPLLKDAKAAAKKLGVVSVNMGETACKVPVATDYIAKIESMNRVGKKRKTVKC